MKRKLVTTLETDGGIRVFAHVDSEWQLVEAVQTLSLVVEVKLERQLLVAVSHSEDGKGTVHVWHIALRTGDSHSPDLQLLNYCHRSFTQPPDKVEARHGGRFIEVQFVSEAVSVDGIYDVEWLEPSTLRRLMAVQRCVGDWRCDLRDAAAVLADRGHDIVLSWLFLWRPLVREENHGAELSTWGSWQQHHCGFSEHSVGPWNSNSASGGPKAVQPSQ